MERKGEKDYHVMPGADFSSPVLSRRSLPPAHYTLKVESFSRILKIFPGNKGAKYESNVFESGGYKWRLAFYPKGRNIWNGKGNISLYLVMAETDSLPLGWEVNAICRLFVLDQIRGEYLAFEDANGKGKLFHAMNTEWGLPNFLSSVMFRDPCNGYLVDDSCVFGVEVFVIKCTGKGELLSILSSPVTGSCNWNIHHLSALKEEYLSKEFRVGEGKWELKLYPKAVSDDDAKSCIKLFLSFCDWEAHPHKAKLYAKYTLRVRDLKVNGHHEEVTDYNWFSASVGRHVYSKFMQRGVLDRLGTLTIGDSFVVEAQIEIISVVTDFTEKK